MKSPEYIAEAKAYLSSMSEHDLDDAGDEFQRLFGYAMELSLALTASDKDAARLRAALERHGTFHADAVRLVQGLFAAFDRPEVHAVAKAEATEWLERVTSRPVLSRAAMEKVNG